MLPMSDHHPDIQRLRVGRWLPCFRHYNFIRATSPTKSSSRQPPFIASFAKSSAPSRSALSTLQNRTAMSRVVSNILIVVWRVWIFAKCSIFLPLLLFHSLTSHVKTFLLTVSWIYSLSVRIIKCLNQTSTAACRRIMSDAETFHQCIVLCLWSLDRSGRSGHSLEVFHLTQRSSCCIDCLDRNRFHRLQLKMDLMDRLVKQDLEFWRQ